MPASFRISLLAVIATAITACGGGSPSGGSAVSNNAPVNVPTSAKVTVLLTDGPGTDWDQAITTITSIELLGDEGQHTIFSGSKTVDILSLPDFYDVFSVADDVPPGTYEKIRLRVDLLELVEFDDEGNELQRVAAQLVGGGKIDLNPQGEFLVGPGDSLFVELDFDMNKAFKTTTTGNGRVIVRPVVLVNISREPPLGRLTRLNGIVEEIDADERSFELCQQHLVSEMHDDDDDIADDDAGDSDDSVCIDVTTDASTGIFGADGLPVAFDALMVGETVTAIGHLRREEDDDSDSDEEDDDDGEEDDDDGDDIVLHAVTIEIGDTFDRVSGTADSFVAGDQFDLALDPGQNLGTDLEILPTQLFPQTRIFRKNGDELDATAIEPGALVLADGVLVTGEGVSDTLRAALLILDLDIGATEDVLRGEIVSVNFDAGTLQLFVGEAEQCVNASDADIFLVSNADGFSSERVGLGSLEPMQAADVFGMGSDDSGCFVASHILASALPGNALPVAEAGEDQTVTAGDAVMLDGSASTDDDGDALTYAWALASVPDGSMAELSAADTAMPSFTTDQAGEYVVELVVNDGLEDSAPDSLTVTAENP